MGVTFLHFQQFSSANTSSPSLPSPSLQQQLALALTLHSGSEYPHFFAACSHASSDAHPATGLPLHSLYKT